MNKNIFDEAKETLTWLLHDEFDDNPKRSRLNVSQRLNMFKKVKDALEQAQQQEKLLELYRQLFQDLGLIIEHDTTDDWTGPVDYEYLEINEDIPKALNTYKQIKELENDK